MKTLGVQRSPQRPRIGIDLHVVDGIFQGSRTHCLELFSRVIALTPECDFFLLSSDPQTLLSTSDSFGLPHVVHVPMPKMPAPARLLWQLPQVVRRWGISLLHTQYISPPLPFCATAVTVHDILFESHKDYFEKAFVLRSRLLVPYSARHSAAVFTVSEFSRKQICDAYSIPLEKVHTIPNGVDHERFFPGVAGRDTVRGLGIDQAFFLTVGRLEPRKNHSTLLRAWAQLRSPRPLLVIVGQRHFSYHDVFDLIGTLQIEQDVLVLEEVPDIALPSIYRNAKGFIYCSWAEGFGMPVLEAMASGIPVISSSTTALPEVCGDAALQVDPGSPDEIGHAVQTLEERADLRDTMVRSGLLRAKEFTWDKPAQKVRNIYLQHFGLSTIRCEVEGFARQTSHTNQGR
jgi:glycosyltransferase involved in cell wall biosynthesis